MVKGVYCLQHIFFMTHGLGSTQGPNHGSTKGLVHGPARMLAHELA